MKKGQFGPKCSRPPAQYMKAAEEWDVEDEEAETNVTRSMKSMQLTAVRPSLKAMPRSCHDSPVMMNDYPTRPNDRLVVLMNNFNRESGSNQGFGFQQQKKDRLGQIETTFCSIHKNVFRLAELQTQGSQISQLQEQRNLIEKEMRLWPEDSRCFFYYKELHSIVEALMAQERISIRAVAEPNYDDLERSLKLKLDHKFNYLDKLSKNIEVVYFTNIE